MQPPARIALAFALLAASLPALSAGTGADTGREVFPGARLEGNGHAVVTRDLELRQPGTTRERSYLPEGAGLDLEATVKVRSQGKTYRVEIWKNGEAEAAVLVVTPEGAKEPTDVAEVRLDRETYLNEKPVSLGSEDAFEVFNAHLNAGEDFNITTLFHLRNGRLRRIAEIYTKSEQAANCAQAFTESLHWEIKPQAGHLPDITADVETVHAPKDYTQDACPRRKIKEWREHSRETYHWDVAKDRYVKVAKHP